MQTRTIETYEDQIFLIRIAGEFICRENVIFGFVSTLIIGILLTSFCLWYVHTYLSETKSCLLKLESETHGRWISARQNNNEERMPQARNLPCQICPSCA